MPKCGTVSAGDEMHHLEASAMVRLPRLALYGVQAASGLHILFDRRTWLLRLGRSLHLLTRLWMGLGSRSCGRRMFQPHSHPHGMCLIL